MRHFSDREVLDMAEEKATFGTKSECTHHCNCWNVLKAIDFNIKLCVFSPIDVLFGSQKTKPNLFIRLSWERNFCPIQTQYLVKEMQSRNVN